jgi:hypothetical protein
MLGISCRASRTFGDFVVTPNALNSKARPISKINGRPGRTFSLIARPTGAYLNFEVKDAPKARSLRPSTILEFKVPIRFSAAIR